MQDFYRLPVLVLQRSGILPVTKTIKCATG